MKRMQDFIACMSGVCPECAEAEVLEIKTGEVPDRGFTAKFRCLNCESKFGFVFEVQNVERY